MTKPVGLPPDPNVAFLSEHDTFGRSLVHREDSEKVWFLARRQDAFCFEQRVVQSGFTKSKKQKPKLYRRWKKRQFIMLKVNQGRVQMFGSRQGSLVNLTNKPAAYTAMAPLAGTRTHVEEIRALARRNNLDLTGIDPGWSDVRHVQALAYPPLREVIVDRKEKIPEVPAFATDLLRSIPTVDEAWERLTNRPEQALRDRLRAYVEGCPNQQIKVTVFYDLLWLLSMTKAVLSATDRLAVVEAFFQNLSAMADMDFVLNRDRILRSSKEHFPTLVRQRELRWLLKEIRDQHGHDRLMVWLPQVLSSPELFLRQLAVHEQEHLVAYMGQHDKFSYFGDDPGVLNQVEADYVQDLRRFFQRMIILGVTVPNDNKYATSLIIPTLGEGEDGTNQAVLFTIYDGRPGQVGSVDFVASYLPGYELWRGSPRLLLDHLVGLWNDSEDRLEACAATDVSDEATARLVAWRILTGKEPTRRVLRLSTLSLSTPLFLKFASNRKKIRLAETCAGLPESFARKVAMV